MVAHVTDDNFEAEVLKSDVPVLVDFYATWCGPCKQVAPIIEELEGEYKGKVKIVKLDVDDANATAGKFQVMSIPTLIFFKDGEPVNKLVGFNSKEKLKKELDSLI